MKINRTRLEGTIEELGRVGATERGGLSRLALSDEDKRGRDLMVAWMRQAGLRVTVDQMGNIFGERAGEPGQAPVMMGSHVDSVPTGGRYDGQLGVLCALESIRTLDDQRVRTRHPVTLVIFTSEEGARFQPAMIASGVMAGKIALEDAYNARDKDGLRLVDELERIGYLGAEPCVPRPLRAYLELHIEQGPILEAEDKTIGVVTGVQGLRWYEATITGRESHAGTTPMPRRRDAFLACAALALEVEKIAEAHAPNAVGTVGRVEVEPNSPNVIPGLVRMTVDIRHHDDAALQAMEDGLHAAIARLVGGGKVRIDVRKLNDSPAVRFDPRCIAAVRAGAEALGFAHRDIISGAGHDAVHLSKVTPTSMIFVPCKDGLSHNEAESATRQHCAAGAQVLLEAALALDAELGGR
jgi:N-carbamoyl-L-amino-acid hydrolase